MLDKFVFKISKNWCFFTRKTFQCLKITKEMFNDQTALRLLQPNPTPSSAFLSLCERSSPTEPQRSLSLVPKLAPPAMASGSQAPGKPLPSASIAGLGSPVFTPGRPLPQPLRVPPPKASQLRSLSAARSPSPTVTQVPSQWLQALPRLMLPQGWELGVDLIQRPLR
jgi:hypothetical protein